MGVGIGCGSAEEVLDAGEFRPNDNPSGIALEVTTEAGRSIESDEAGGAARFESPGSDKPSGMPEKLSPLFDASFEIFRLSKLNESDFAEGVDGRARPSGISKAEAEDETGAETSSMAFACET
jgi:hypothetical protein